ncbi:MAG: cobalamin-dependent protein [Proteobacteria bacterium]|nr:cobalamin-dependent protein [Pseudomonadota bacterium]MBU4470133.1 cobalamin-dependent protein [Pseudomonadota bacterium]MCG2753116.1 cobalamin-dependent protein [Desulfobacteraceae bacterium]
MTEKLVDAIVEMQEEEALKLVAEFMNQGEDPIRILDACSAAMAIVGKRFETGEYFLPHLIMSGEILKQISEKVKSGLAADFERKTLGRVVMGTVEGDIHNIGKDIVCFLLEVNGFEVRDIGVDVSPAKFVEAIREFKPRVVGMSGLLTLAYDSMKNTVKAIEEAGLRDSVKIMIGGAPTSEKVCVYAGADAHGSDAMAAISLAKQWMGGD